MALKGIDLPSLDKRAVQMKWLDRTLRALNNRCSADPERTRFASAVKKWVSNGGMLPVGLRESDAAGVLRTVLAATPGAAANTDMSVESPVAQHLVLQANYRLQSKAFMLTHNSRSFTAETWPCYRSWALQRSVELKARAWSTCWEESLHADVVVAGGTKTFHGHTYLFWDSDSSGVDLENLDVLAYNRDLWQTPA